MRATSRYGRGVRPVLLVFVVVLVASCASDREPSGARATLHDIEAWCIASCERFVRCGEARDERCVARCASPQLRLVRSEYATWMRTCLEAMPCDRTGECLRYAAHSVEPTPLLRDVCERKAAKSATCTGVRAQVELCLLGWVAYSDETLARVRACLAGPCATYGECISDELDG